MPDESFRIEEVGEVDTPDGPTRIRRGATTDGSDDADLEIDGIQVSVSSSADAVEATWWLPPTQITVSTRSLDEDALREILPALVDTASTPQLADAVASRIPGAEVRYAGPAPGYDVGLSYEDATLSIAGRGVADAQLDAFYGLLGWQPADGGTEWGAELEGGADARASGATVVVAAGPPRPAVTSSTFAAVVDELMGDSLPVVAVSEGLVGVADPSCARPSEPGTGTGVTIRDVSIAESDVGDVLRITFDGLPGDQADPQMVHVVVGGVELVAEYDGDETVMFPATLTHAEARLLAERLAP